MKSDELLIKARIQLLELLDALCESLQLLEDRNRLTIHLINGIRIYIRYNNYNQYSYVIQYSHGKFDRDRFDNYNEEWDVKTKPHHHHKRGSQIVPESKMRGIPSQDMIILNQNIREFLDK